MLVFHSLSLYLSRLIVVTRLKSLSSLLMMRAFFARVKVPKRTSHFSNHSNGEKSSFFESIIIIIFIKSVMMSSFLHQKRDDVVLLSTDDDDEDEDYD